MRIGQTIYLDHQATTPTDERVLKAMLPYFDKEFGNPHSTDHIMGWNAAKVVHESAAKVAYLIGADPDEIVFTSGATEANNLSLLGLARSNKNRKRTRILVADTEHKSVLACASAIREQLGYNVQRIPVNRDGTIEVATLESLLTEDVLLVSIALVNGEIGTIQNVKAMSELCKQRDTLLHCDAAQAFGINELSDLSEFADLISLSGHKMYGPKGIGALFIRHSLQAHIEPLIYGGGQQRGMRSGTLSTPLCVGMGTAAELMLDKGIIKERFRVTALRNRFFNGLQNLEWQITLNGPSLEDRSPGNLNVRFVGISSQDILSRLQPKLAASTGSACTSGSPEPSYVLRAIGLSTYEASECIRFGLGRFTTERDVDDSVELIKSALEQYTQNSNTLLE
jgi:cysteine desulfurase